MSSETSRIDECTGSLRSWTKDTAPKARPNPQTSRPISNSASAPTTPARPARRERLRPGGSAPSCSREPGKRLVRSDVVVGTTLTMTPEWEIATLLSVGTLGPGDHRRTMTFGSGRSGRGVSPAGASWRRAQGPLENGDHSRTLGTVSYTHLRAHG